MSIFEFDRYINGILMAEGVTIERQPDLASAMQSAALRCAEAAGLGSTWLPAVRVVA